MQIVVNSCLLIFYPLFTFSNIIRPLSIWKITELPAVTRFEGIEEYYMNLRSQYAPDTHPQEATQPQRRANIKKQICKSIFNAPYFKMYEQEWVDIDNEEIRSQLREHYWDIFERIFDRNDTSRSNFKYENPYRSYKVRIKSTFHDECGFICPVRRIESRKVEEFVVSREYNINSVKEYFYFYFNEEIRADQYPIAGRFVFARNDLDQLTLLAMAEESGTELVPWPVRNSLIANLLNLTERYNEDLFATLTDNPDLDPVCQLDDSFKLRLCATLFAASSFKNKVIFYPAMNNILPQCKKKTISIIGTDTVTNFLDEYIRPSWGRIFEEWVIGCRAVKNTGDIEIYYVSRGMWPNSVFMYKDAGHKNLSTYNYFYNVSVVHE